MDNNYDNAAWFYDSLSRLVFGKAIVKAQIYLLQHIPPGSNLLIVGGGTGWILEELAKIHSQGLRVSYVEVSGKMLALARNRVVGSNEVKYIHAPLEEVRFPEKFDVIITPFLFDSFNEPTLERSFQHLDQLLKADGIWLYADFRKTGVWWQQALLKIMLTFFKVLCGIEAEQLPDVDRQFALNGYRMIAEKTFIGSFIVARIYSITYSAEVYRKVE